MNWKEEEKTKWELVAVDSCIYGKDKWSGVIDFGGKNSSVLSQQKSLIKNEAWAVLIQ